MISEVHKAYWATHDISNTKLSSVVGNRTFALTTTTRMLRGKLLYSEFFCCEELLVHDTDLHNKGCSEMHSGSFK